ncbi:unnamed protein product [Musa acuminata var. zebrina]
MEGSNAKDWISVAFDTWVIQEEEEEHSIVRTRWIGLIIHAGFPGLHPHQHQIQVSYVKFETNLQVSIALMFV